MKDLKCGKKACKHNKGYCCCARKIEVANNTDCLTYEPVEKKASMFEAGSDFIKADYSVDTSVACEANCIFQKNNKCIAGGITVMGDGSEALCLTFVKD
ncbi:MAG: DUF1540 domain-containing protein [Clostridiales bacterium]|nr:DUF1540 domain-containing protein [Clostridiales bacterium]